MDKKPLSMEELKRALKDFKTTELEDTDLQVQVFKFSYMMTWRMSFKYQSQMV